ncbi:MAG TPA: hydroxyethylthiazole kinase [Pseudogracilibacillus sp.]|nr:hydroxyethylthiazole kinase [Pseudogracilibacillus sp.]
MRSIKTVRNKRLNIYHLINQTHQRFTADGLASFGNTAIFSKEPKEAKEIASHADGVFIHMGSTRANEMEPLILAGIEANKRGIPIVLDPSDAAHSTFHHRLVKKLLETISFTAIKGNPKDMAALAGMSWNNPDANSADQDYSKRETIALHIAKQYNTIAVVTGKSDLIAEFTDVTANHAGHPYLARTTGTGCLLGSLLTACLTTDVPKFIAAYEATQFFGETAEKAATLYGVNGPGTFTAHFIDVLGGPINR